MRHISAVLLLLASTAISASAQSFAPHSAPRPVALQALPPEPNHEPAIAAHTPLPAQRAVPTNADEPKPRRSRKSRILRSAAVGAVLGFATGAAIAAEIGGNCDLTDPPDCSVSARNRQNILRGGGIAAGLGAILGAGVGAVRR
jgi:hypothetical protein